MGTRSTAANSNNTKNSTTAKQNYTAIRHGNDHGSISFGHIHKQGDVTSDVMLQATDERHSIILDKDGPRKGCTQITAPGRIAIECGVDKKEAEDTLFIHSWNGNIVINASNGKLRLQGTDVEIIATGEGGSKGNIRLKAPSNSIELDGKKVLITAKSKYKLATSGSAEIVANSSMKIYSSIIRGVTDACAIKDSKVGGRDYQSKQQK
jgi:hypothetical protein